MFERIWKLKMFKKVSCPMKKLAVLLAAAALIPGRAEFYRHFCPSHPKHIWISGTKRCRMQVQVGQRYFQTLAFVSYNEVWRVTSICSDGERIWHARLVNVRNTSETKTLSCSALDGRYGFRLLNV